MRIGFIAALLAFSAFADAQEVKLGSKVDQIAVSGISISPSNTKATVIMFVSTKCPISNDYTERMNAVYKEYSTKGVQFLFVNANNNEDVAEIAEHSQANGIIYKVYKDANNALADKFGASVTPEAYVFDQSGTLQYHGYVDDSRNPARIRVRGLRNALDAVMAGQPVQMKQSKAFGCTIKRVKKAS